MTKRIIHADMVMAVRTEADADSYEEAIKKAKINFAAGDFETGEALGDAKDLV